jgi:pimeloyl-ACP methyl ester carboxylesterase
MSTNDLMIDGPIGKLSVRTKGLDRDSKHVAVLVQGANLTGQTAYDFDFPGGYSLMDGLVARGIAAITFSVRGYGKSTPPENPLSVDTDAAIEDLTAVLAWLAEQGHKRPHLIGWSWGGRITGRFTGAHADQVDRLVMVDPAIGGGNKILPFPTEVWWHNTAAYFLDRLESEFMDKGAHEAIAAYAEANELKAPNGIRQENALGSIPVDPTLVTRPTLMIYGAAAGQQNYMQGGAQREEFFRLLATDDKALAIIPGGGDYAHLQNPRHRFYTAIANFILAAD